MNCWLIRCFNCLLGDGFMNYLQKLTAVVGSLSIFFIIMFPPWIIKRTGSHDGFHFIGSKSFRGDNFFASSINTELLAILVLSVSVIVGLVILVFKDKAK